MKDPIVNIAVRAARAAGNIIVRASDRLDTLKITEKNPNDYVSEVDQMAEREIINVIKKAHPDHSILSEECGAIKGKNPDITWIIDPLDGTRNYIHGFPHYAVSIAIKIKNRIEHGVIYDPVRQELFTATRGRGAQLNERRIRVSKRTELKDCLLATGFCHGNLSDHATETKAFNELLSLSGNIRINGSAVLDLAYVACGRLDGSWGQGLKIWDLAAGTLMIKEAGGLACDFTGAEKFLESGNVISGNLKILKVLLKSLAA